MTGVQTCALPISLNAKQNSITPYSPSAWVFDAQNPTLTGLGLSSTASYTMGGATINGDTTIGSSSSNKNLTVNGTATVNNLSVSGTINGGSFFSQVFFSSGYINNTASIITSSGTGFTCSKLSTGVYQITFNSNHPRSLYGVMVTAQTNVVDYGTYSYIANTGFRVQMFNSGGTATDNFFSFLVFL